MTIDEMVKKVDAYNEIAPAFNAPRAVLKMYKEPWSRFEKAVRVVGVDGIIECVKCGASMFYDGYEFGMVSYFTEDIGGGHSSETRIMFDIDNERKEN